MRRIESIATFTPPAAVRSTADAVRSSLRGSSYRAWGIGFALAGVLAFDHGTSWHHYDESYVGRNYFRFEEPAGACNAARTDVAATRIPDSPGP